LAFQGSGPGFDLSHMLDDADASSGAKAKNERAKNEHGAKHTYLRGSFRPTA